jgi:hypothetical protein
MACMSGSRGMTMRLFKKAVLLIILLGVVGCQTASEPPVRPPAPHHTGHGGRNG